jgi:hypothetical protein
MKTHSYWLFRGVEEFVLSGFLKVSIHEVLIALRDDAHLLVEPNTEPSYSDNSKLYPNGFSAGEFVKNIEQQAVWTANDLEL